MDRFNKKFMLEKLKNRKIPDIFLSGLTLMRLFPIIMLTTFAAMIYFETSNQETLYWIQINMGIQKNGIALYSILMAVLYGAFFIKPKWWYTAEPMRIVIATLLRVFCLFPISAFGVLTIVLVSSVFENYPRSIIWAWGMIFLFEHITLIMWLGLSQIMLELRGK